MNLPQLIADVIAGCVGGVTVWLLLNYLARKDDRRLAPTPFADSMREVMATDHTSEYLQLVRDAMATVERIAVPPAVQLPDYADVPQPATWDLDALDPTDTTPWLLAGNTPFENTVNVAPAPATHPMGIPGLLPPEHMQFRDAKDEHPFDRFRVDV